MPPSSTNLPRPERSASSVDEREIRTLLDALTYDQQVKDVAASIFSEVLQQRISEQQISPEMLSQLAGELSGFLRVDGDRPNCTRVSDIRVDPNDHNRITAVLEIAVPLEDIDISFVL